MSQPKIKDRALALSAANATQLNGAIAGIGNSNLVQLDSNAKLPAVDGSALTDVVTTFRGVLAYSSVTPFPIVPTGTPTVLDFNNELYDTENLHDTVTNNSRHTVPSGVTKVRLTAIVSWPSNATGYRKVEFLENAGAMPAGNSIAIQNTVSGEAIIQTITTGVIETQATDYFEVQVTQTSGGTLNPNLGTGGTIFIMELIE